MRRLLNWLRQRPLLNWLCQRPLIPRRFESHFWDGDGCLIFTKWWQWRHRCFFIRKCTIMRPIFSTWEEILTRSEVGDKDACVIRQLIVPLSDSSGETCITIYNRKVDETRQILKIKIKIKNSKLKNEMKNETRITKR